MKTEEEEEGDADSITRAAWAERAVARRRLHLQETRIQYSSREAIAEQYFSVEKAFAAKTIVKRIGTEIMNLRLHFYVCLLPVIPELYFNNGAAVTE